MILIFIALVTHDPLYYFSVLSNKYWKVLKYKEELVWKGNLYKTVYGNSFLRRTVIRIIFSAIRMLSFDPWSKWVKADSQWAPFFLGLFPNSSPVYFSSLFSFLFLYFHSFYLHILYLHSLVLAIQLYIEWIPIEKY